MSREALETVFIDLIKNGMHVTGHEGFSLCRVAPLDPGVGTVTVPNHTDTEALFHGLARASGGRRGVVEPVVNECPAQKHAAKVGHYGDAVPFAPRRSQTEEKSENIHSDDDVSDLLESEGHRDDEKEQHLNAPMGNDRSDRNHDGEDRGGGSNTGCIRAENDVLDERQPPAREPDQHITC